MAGKQRRELVADTAGKVAASKNFGRYKKEDKTNERKSVVKENQAFQRIVEQWKKYSGIADDFGGSCAWVEDRLMIYRLTLEWFQKLAYKPDDVSRFILATNNENSGYIGIFISALISSGKHMKYEIPFCNFPIDDLGLRNIKTVWINGDAGNSVGFSMEKGLVRVGGNAGWQCGMDMKGGTLQIYGNAGSNLAQTMSGGKISISGNAGEDVGHGMTGGEIHVDGEIGSVGKVIHGKIYHKGKLIMDK